MHPFAKARERTRALNAAKIERIFAKPFVAALEGHMEAVETMSRRPESLTAVASGSWDGGMCVCRGSGSYPFAVLKTLRTKGLIVHDIAQRIHLMRVNDAHKGKISGVCFSDEHRLLSCGVDRNVKLWDTREVDANGAGPSEVRQMTTYPSMLYSCTV